MVVDSLGKVHVAYTGRTDGEVYYLTRTPGDSTWTTPLSISENATPSKEPRLGVDASQNVYFLWKDLGGPDNEDIFYREMINGTLGTVENISNLSSRSEYHRLKVAPDGTVHTVWSEWSVGDDGGG